MAHDLGSICNIGTVHYKQESSEMVKDTKVPGRDRQSNLADGHRLSTLLNPELSLSTAGTKRTSQSVLQRHCERPAVDAIS